MRMLDTSTSDRVCPKCGGASPGLQYWPVGHTVSVSKAYPNSEYYEVSKDGTLTVTKECLYVRCSRCCFAWLCDTRDAVKDESVEDDTEPQTVLPIIDTSRENEQLDEFVARLLGWVPKRLCREVLRDTDDEDASVCCLHMSPPDPNECVPGERGESWEECDQGVVSEHPAYSSDPRMIHYVLDHLRSLGLVVRLQYLPIGNDVEVAVHNSNGALMYTVSGPVALAVCCALVWYVRTSEPEEYLWALRSIGKLDAPFAFQEVEDE